MDLVLNIQTLIGCQNVYKKSKNQNIMKCVWIVLIYLSHNKIYTLSLRNVFLKMTKIY